MGQPGPALWPKEASAPSLAARAWGALKLPAAAGTVGFATGMGKGTLDKTENRAQLAQNAATFGAGEVLSSIRSSPLKSLAALLAPSSLLYGHLEKTAPGVGDAASFFDARQRIEANTGTKLPMPQALEEFASRSGNGILPDWTPDFARNWLYKRM
jgi:hypothetical protein